MRPPASGHDLRRSSRHANRQAARPPKPAHRGTRLRPSESHSRASRCSSIAGRGHEQDDRALLSSSVRKPGPLDDRRRPTPTAGVVHSNLPLADTLPRRQ